MKTSEPYEEWLRRNLPETWEIPRHISLISAALDQVLAGTVDRLLISMPPRHGKSETVTVRLPLRFLQLHPDENVLVTGYNERFARKFGRRTRNMALGLVAEDKSAADEWATTSGGLYMARGVGSPPTGTGFKLIIIDDPVRSRIDVESETKRENHWDWYSNDLYTRLEPGGAIVMVMTRWHEDDIAARALESEPGMWHVLSLPAINDAGEALWPNRYDLKALERFRSTMGERDFEALFQGNPTPREGSLFRVSQIGIVDAIPRHARHVQAWDLAATEGGGDWTACVDAYEWDGIYYMDPYRIQSEPFERNKAIRQRVELKSPGKVIIPEDPGPGGKESAASLVRLLAGFSVSKVRPDRTTGGKEVRAEPFAAQVNAGNVRVLKGPFAAAYIEELRGFPAGKHDDMVDASSDAFNALARPTRNWMDAAMKAMESM